jgi:arabinan endo-1,5-alpha-L-arabinosidase
MNNNYHEILIHVNDRFTGTGHNSEIITDKKDKTWILYHAIDRIRPECRKLMLNEVHWKEGWPFVKEGEPCLSNVYPSF